MKRLVLFLPLVILAAYWYLPTGKEEREFLTLKRENKWQLCEYRRESDKLFVLRLYDKLYPPIQFIRSLSPSKERSLFRFKLTPEPVVIDGVHPSYWDDVREKIPRLSDWLSISAWQDWFHWVEWMKVTEGRVNSRNANWQEHFRFQSTSAVERTGRHELTVRLDPGSFTPAQKVLSEAMEKTWNLPPYLVKIFWVKNDPNAFRLGIAEKRENASVDWTQKTLTLHETESIGTPAHELGHVLGFPDHYYYYIDQHRCKITKRMYWRDLMGNAAYEKALVGHWKLLMKAYPFQGKPLKEFSYRQGEVLDGEK